MKNEIKTPIILEDLSDLELLNIVDECQKDSFDENSIVRILSKQYFGGDSLTQMIFVVNKLLPIVAERMKNYSPHLFQSKIDTLKSKIFEQNLLLLDISDYNSEYELQKLYDWQEDYNWVTWDEFKNGWFYCDRCKGYSEGSCICYAR